MRTIKEALEEGSLSLEDEIDYADMTEEEYKKEIERLNNDIKTLLQENGNKENVIKAQDNIINKAIKYIKEHCIDDEFYINLSNKEKGIIDVLTILENGSVSNE